MERSTGTLLTGALLIGLLSLFLAGQFQQRSLTTQAAPTATQPSTLTAVPTATATIALEATVRALIATRAAEVDAQLTAVAQQIATLDAQATAATAAVTVVTRIVGAPPPATGTAVPAAATAADQSAAPTATTDTPPVSSDQARDAALSYLGGGQVTAVQLVRSGAQTIYEVSVAGGSVFIDAVSAAVVGSSVAPTPTAVPQAIRAEQAADIARGYHSGSAVESVKRTVERGADVYEVEFADGSEVYVDALRGVVVFAQIQSNPADNRDDDDDDDDNDSDDDSNDD